jgi:phosphate transport system substrate-binding protein
MTPRTLTLLVPALLLAGCASGPGPGAGDDSPFQPPQQTTSLTGSGATFPKPLIETWAIEYARGHPTVQVGYGGGGSGKGISDISAKMVLFGASDAPLSRAEKAKAEEGGHAILQFPDTLGVVGLAYNLPGIGTLRLDGEAIGKIYTGAIQRWNDPALAALNPGVPLPDAAIAVVYRSDSSGTTFVFTDYLAKASPSWAATMGDAASKKPDWTRSSATQLSGNGNDGVGNTVKSTPNSIGYVELAFLRSLGLSAAAVQAKDGAFLPPTTAGAAAAAGAVATGLPAPDGDWSQISIVNAPGAEAYPISSFSYILVYQDRGAYGGQVSEAQMAAFKAWMWWSLHDGQEHAEPLGYAPLPDPVVAIGERALRSMR